METKSGPAAGAAFLFQADESLQGAGYMAVILPKTNMKKSLNTAVRFLLIGLPTFWFTKLGICIKYLCKLSNL